MPLVLNTQPETERPQLIVFDPSIAEDYDYAIEKRDELTSKGFTVTRQDFNGGEIKLDPPPLASELGVMRIISQNGDDRLTWNRTLPKEVKDAFKKFKNLVQKGYSGYATKSDGSKGHKIDEFDPALGEVVMVPATAPG